MYLEIHATKILWFFVSVLVYLVGSSETRRFTKNRYELDENQTTCKKHTRCAWPSIGSTMFYFKPRSFPLVYVGAISDSYTIPFLSRCLTKTTTKLATACKNSQTPRFLDLGVLRAFCGFLRGVLVVLFAFCRFGAKLL